MSGEGNLIKGLLASSDGILSIRQNIGAALRKVFLVTRKWDGRRIGDGNLTETVCEVVPTPGIKDLSNDHRVKEGGAVQSGDIMVKMISKKEYPTEKDINCQTDDNLIEKFFRVGDVFYTVIQVHENHLTWDVQLRRKSDQRSITEL